MTAARARPRAATPWSSPWLILAITVLCAGAYGGHDLVRYLAYHAPAYDLAFFDQVCENLRGGRGFTTSFLSYSFLGQHWEPVLLVWAQLDRLAPTPVWLLLINSAALALTPWAAWRLAHAWVPQLPYAPITAAVATALNPLVVRTAAFDYHSEALTPVLALLALEGAHRRRWWQLAICCAALACVKEDALLVVAGIGWLVWCVDRHRVGLVLSVAALVGFAALVGVVMPALRGGATGDLLGRYAYLGGDSPASAAAVLGGIMVHPTRWITQLTSAAAREGMLVALLPLGFAPLAAGRAMLAFVPALVLPLLSEDSIQAALHLHYGAEAFPLLLACSLVGMGSVARRWAPSPEGRRLERVLPAAAISALGAVAVTISVMLYNVHLSDFDGLDRRATVESILARVPAQSGVAASTNLVAHLSNRIGIWEFPGPGGVEYVVIDDLASPSAPASGAGYFAQVGGLASAYQVVASGQGVTLWRRR